MKKLAPFLYPAQNNLPTIDFYVFKQNSGSCSSFLHTKNKQKSQEGCDT